MLERAGTSYGVRVLLITGRPAMERVLEYVVQGNTAQLADPAFVREIKSWVRFNGADAVSTRDGLFSVCTGNPAIPAWLGELAFGWFFTAQGENDKIARQVRNSAGIAVFVGQAAEKAHWVEVGRTYERFATGWYALAIWVRPRHSPTGARARSIPDQRAKIAPACAGSSAGPRIRSIIRSGPAASAPSSTRLCASMASSACAGSMPRSSP